MGALTGLLHFDDSPVVPDVFAGMLDALAHRGTDVVGSWIKGTAGLGARFDRITPESRSAEAVACTPDGRFVAVADARLDDRETLARVLSLSPERPDADLIAHAFARWGDETPRRLTGDFAFAVWDSLERRLFCARDRMGVRPFYYLHEPGRRFAFATETRALRVLPGFPYRLDEAHLADYLLVTLDHTSTFFRDVRRLAAATSLVVTESGPATPVSYWQPDPETELRLGSDAAYAEAFFDHFQRAVTDRMRSLHPVGAALSGGLDSSSISVVAREASPAETLPVFSAQFAGLPDHLHPLIDERPFVASVVARGGYALHVVEATEIGPFSDFETMSWHLEDIFRTVNLYLHWGMFAAAQQAGVRIFLDGTDGDTVVSHGFDRLTALAQRGDWAAFIHEVRAFPDASTQRWFAWNYGVAPLAEAFGRGHVWQALQGGGALRNAFGFGARKILRAYADTLQSRKKREEALRASFIQPAFARREAAWERHRAAQPTFLPDARAAHARGLRSPLFPHMLEMADRAAAAFGVEPRYPFFDHRLMEFCLSLPAEQKLGGGMARRVMRHALAGRLPEALRLRTTKANLKPAFDLALARAAPVEVEPFLFADDLAVAPYVDVAALRSAYRQFMRDPLRHSHTGTQLYSIATLERGLRRLTLT